MGCRRSSKQQENFGMFVRKRTDRQPSARLTTQLTCECDAAMPLYRAYCFDPAGKIFSTEDRSDRIGLGMEAYRALQRAQAALRTTARQLRAADAAERDRLAQDTKTALLRVVAASRAFMAIKTAMDADSRARLWQKIETLDDAALR